MCLVGRHVLNYSVVQLARRKWQEREKGEGGGNEEGKEAGPTRLPERGLGAPRAQRRGGHSVNGHATAGRRPTARAAAPGPNGASGCRPGQRGRRWERPG